MDCYAELGVLSSQFYPDWFDMPECKEGGAAFSEKRTPRFWSLRKSASRIRDKILAESGGEGQ